MHEFVTGIGMLVLFATACFFGMIIFLLFNVAGLLSKAIGVSKKDGFLAVLDLIRATQNPDHKPLFELLLQKGASVNGEKLAKMMFDPSNGGFMQQSVTGADGVTRTRKWKLDHVTGKWVEVTDEGKKEQDALAAIDSGESDDPETLEAEVVDPAASSYDKGATPLQANADSPVVVQQSVMPPTSDSKAPSGVRHCPHCDALLQGDYNFCLSCGHALGM